MIPFFENREERLSASVVEKLTFPLHQHTHLELFYVLQGESQVIVRQESQILKPGGLAVIFPNQTHSYRCVDPGCKAALIICDLSLTGSTAAILSGQHPLHPFLPSSRLHPNVGYALRELLMEYGEYGETPVCGPLIQLILARVLPMLSLQKNQSADSLDLTSRIIHHISQHFQEPLSLEDLARTLGVSKFHLSRVFSEKMGMGFPEYLNSIRLGHAITLITDTDKTITEISADAGFESERSFYRAFRHRYHETPLQYRKKQRHIS